jgi:hypothetical protein
MIIRIVERNGQIDVDVLSRVGYGHKTWAYDEKTQQALL